MTPDWILQTLSRRQEQTLFREITPVSTGSDACLHYHGTPYLNLSSSNYLGLAHHPRILSALVAGAQCHGTASGASPLITGYGPAHAQLDTQLAQMLSAGRAIHFATGYAASLGVMSALARPGDTVWADSLSHASLIDGVRMAHAHLRFYRHLDLDDLTARLHRAPNRGHRWIVTDGVFSMDGDTAPIPDLLAIAQQFDALLVVDDAHGIGVLGERGRGVAEAYRRLGDIPILIGSFSKALGGQGGFVAGPTEILSYLIQHARSWIYSSALATPLAAAAYEALALIDAEPERRDRVLALSHRMRRGLEGLGYRLVPTAFPECPIIAVLLGSSERALDCAAALRRRGLWVTAIRPPTVPTGASRIRLSLMADHTLEHIDTALAHFAALASVYAGS